MQFASLYQRLLGGRYGQLPESLRAFHGGAECTCVEGRLAVVHGRRSLTRVCARLLGFPAPGRQVPVRLRVTRSGETERWERSIGGYQLTTVQSRRGDFLVERRGAFSFWFRLRSIRGGYRVEFHRMSFLRAPVPRPLALRIAATAVGNAAGWTVRVNIANQLLGTLCAYRGRVMVRNT